MTLRRHLVVSALVVAAVPALAACGDQVEAAGGGTTNVDLAGPWQLASGQLSGVQLDLSQDRTITLTITGDQVSGSSACNSYGGTAKIDGASIRIRELGGTEMACDPAVMDLEQAYLQGLGSVESAVRVGANLVLSGPSSRLTFEPVPPVVDRALVGTTWVLDTLFQGDAASSGIAGARLTLADDATVAGTAGCQPFTGTYRLREDRLRLSFEVKTATSCTPDTQSGQVLDILAEELTVQIEGDFLTLTAASGAGLGYRADGPAD